VLGVPGVPVRDIDILLSVADAKRIMGQLGVVSLPDQGSDRFCSQVYAQVGETIQFDFMAGLKVRANDGRVPVSPRPTSRVMFGEWPIYLPSRADMAGILRLFGRPKDLARLDLLERNVRP
jgi:signal peptidase I